MFCETFQKNLYSEFFKEMFYMFDRFLNATKLLSNNLIICLWRTSVNILNKIFHLFTHMEIDMYLRIHTYLHILLINEFLYLWIQKLLVYDPCHGTNKARFPPVFIALQLRSILVAWDGMSPLPCLDLKGFLCFMYRCARCLIVVVLSCRHSHTAHGDPTGYL